MKRSLNMICGTLMLIMLMGGSSTAQESAKRIDAAIKVGNAQALSAYFGPKVDLTLLDKQDNYSKAQAEQILRGFFAKHQVTDYKVIHHGSAKDGAEYYIGSLSTSEQQFRTYLLVRSGNSKKRIQQLRIESSD